MKCACIRGTYDFDLQQTECGSIIYTDRSTFQTGPQYADPRYTLNVTLPDGSVKNYEVIVGIPLKLDFGSCVQPGIYTFSVNSCTERFYKRTAITCTLWCGWLKAVAKIGKGVEYPTVDSIEKNIKYAEMVSATDFVTAAALIGIVERQLERINCDCSCS